MPINHYANGLPAGAIGRLGTRRFHGAGREMVFLPAGTVVITGNSLRWIEVRSGKELRSKHGHKAAITSLALAPDGQTIASGSEDTTIILWDVTGKRLMHLRQNSNDVVKPADLGEPPPMAVFGVGFFSDGRKLVSAHRNGKLIIWDVRKATIVNAFQLRGKFLWKIAISTSRDIGCVCFAGGELVALDLNTGKQLWSRRGPKVRFGDLAVSPDGRCFASAGADGLVCFREASTGNLFHKYQGPSEGVAGVAFSEDGSLLAVGGIYGPIEIHATKSADVIRTLAVLGEPACLRFSPDGTTLASVISSGMGLWDVATGNELMCVSGPSFIQDMALSPDGCAVALGESQSVGIWDLVTGRQIRQLKSPNQMVVFAPDGKTLACAALNEPIGVWHAEKNEEMFSFGAQKRVRTLVFSPKGEFLASGETDAKKGSRIMVWNLERRKLEVVIQSEPWPSLERLEQEWVRACEAGKVYDEDQKVAFLEAATDNTWDCICLAFSPDGTILASAGCETSDPSPTAVIRLWAFPQLREWRELKGHRSYIQALAFSPSGHMLASGSHDKTVMVWDLTTDQPRFMLKSHTDTVNSVSFSPDSRFLASGSQDGTVCLWDPNTGQNLRKLKGHGDAVLKVAFHPNGKTLFSASFDCTVLFWDVSKVFPLTGKELRITEEKDRLEGK